MSEFGDIHNTFCNKVSIICKNIVKFASISNTTVKFTKDGDNVTAISLKHNKPLVSFNYHGVSQNDIIFSIVQSAKEILQQEEGVSTFQLVRW